MFRSQPHSETFRLLAMDINTLPGSGIVAVARRAVAIPGIEFLCYGESDQPSPQAAHDAAVAALDAGFTRYPDVRGVPALRDSLAAYLTGLHAKPVDRGPDPGHRLRHGRDVDRAGRHRAPRRPRGAAQPDLAQHRQRRAPARRGNRRRWTWSRSRTAASASTWTGWTQCCEGARAFILNSPNNPTGWTATREELQAILEIARRHGVWLISDEVYSRLIYTAPPQPLPCSTSPNPTTR